MTCLNLFGINFSVWWEVGVRVDFFPSGWPAVPALSYPFSIRSLSHRYRHSKGQAVLLGFLGYPSVEREKLFLSRVLTPSLISRYIPDTPKFYLISLWNFLGLAMSCSDWFMCSVWTRMASVPVKERVKVSQNWRLGRCREGILLKWRCSQMPWMQLEGDSLYISQANFILAYQFRPDGASLNRRPLGVFAGHDEDVCHFVLANSHIISAGGDGKIGVHKIHSTFTVKYSAHEQEVNCVDCRGGIIVSGSRDRTAKVWPLASGRLGQCLHTIQTEDRVWSIAISPLLSSFVTGTACCGHFSPLRIWDLNRGQLMMHLGSDFPPGAGVLDVMYESPSTLLSCGYDTYVRYWDLRASVRKCVMEWEEPHDSTLYCLQTDGNHLLATGSSYYGVVRLWDRRQRACLHAFPLTSTPLSSPVYCLRFTTKHLYAALSYNLHVLDFQNP
ncbi:F-box/WD repeat-containing protein 4 isoform X1 [Suricata suricatta]|uniref:F-box and WD repeat domain containing 4 n=1 Tax=Suricata suricatta TaxID=37032 RepID=A0A673SUD6_SURSU|nr:F-box/WD repeat-containing protein 4 isoform X1 [Suricata suricatta]